MSRQDQIQYYQDELMVLAPAPVQSMQSVQMEFAASTPKPARPLCEHSTGNPLEVPPTLPSQLTEAVNEAVGDSSTNETDLHVPPPSLSLIRANSCSRENFASKLVKEMLTAEERSSANEKGVLGKKKSNEKKMLYVQKPTFENYPCAAVEQKKWWAKCVGAIYSASRTLCRSMKKSSKENETPV